MTEKLDAAIEKALPVLEWLFTTQFEKGLVRLDGQIRRELLRQDGCVFRMLVAEGVEGVDQMAAYVMVKLMTRAKDNASP